MSDSALSYERLATSKILIDRLSRNAMSLARLLSELGAPVQLVDPGSIPPELLADCQQLAGQGVSIKTDCDLNTTTFAYDLLFADLYPPPTRPAIVEARQQGKLVSNLADAVLQLSPLPKIGITGTAGKSTTTALLNAMLVAAGQKTYTGGDDDETENLWPNDELLDELPHMQPPAWLVAELTSSHLEYMHTSPDIAIVTNLSPDHVEWHGSLEAYVGAKETILRYQSCQQLAILNYDDLARSIFTPACRGQVAYFSLTDELEQGVFLKEDRIVARWQDYLQTICTLADVRLSWRYLENVLAACAGAVAAGAPIDAIGPVIREFKGLSYRLQFAGNVAGVPVFNDGSAITPKKASASLESFPDQSLILIAGGKIQTAWSDELHRSPEEKAQLAVTCRLAGTKAKAIFLFGEAAPLLRASLLAQQYPASTIYAVNTLSSALQGAINLVTIVDAILLAPIFFLSSAERRAFNGLVCEYAMKYNHPEKFL